MKSALSVLVVCVSTAVASASTVNLTVFNTGVDALGGVLADGTIGDPHYALVSVPGGPTDIRVKSAASGFPVGPWLGDDLLSRWIGPNSGAELTGPQGNYDYQTTFTMPADGIVTLTGLWSTDNAGVDIDLNGAPTGNTIAPDTGGAQPYAFEHWTTFTITAAAHVGVNTLDFIVYNGYGAQDAGPTGVRVEFTSAVASVPLPASIWGGAGLLGALGVWKSRRRRA